MKLLLLFWLLVWIGCFCIPCCCLVQDILSLWT